MKVGLVGTGMLGSAVGARLLGAGVEVSVYNRTREKTRALEDMGAAVAGSPKSMAETSDIILIVVRDADAVRRVSFGSDGIVRGAHDGLIVADMSTIDPAESKRITAEFARHGIRKIDVPVMGGPNAAASGDLVVMCSGEKGAFESARQVLERVGREIIYLGGDGVAHSVKLAMNLQIAMLALALSEGIILTEKSGVAPESFLKVLNSTYFRTGMSQNKAYKMISGSHEPTFTLENLRKDIDTITGAAESLGTILPMASAAGEIYGRAVGEGFGKIDYTGIISYLKARGPHARENQDA